MSLFKEILFHDIESNLRDFAVQPKSFEENKQILQKYYEYGGPMKGNSWLSFTFSQMNYENKWRSSDISKKYTLLKKSLNNKFSSNDSNDYLNSFSRAQKICFAFSRLAFACVGTRKPLFVTKKICSCSLYLKLKKTLLLFMKITTNIFSGSQKY